MSVEGGSQKLLAQGVKRKALFSLNLNLEP